MKLTIDSIKDAYGNYIHVESTDRSPYSHRALADFLLKHAIPYLLGRLDVFNTALIEKYQDNWQPISTWHKPNDTEWVLVWGHEVDRPDDFNMHEVKWYPQEELFWGHGDKVIIPTHWQPLLEGPKL